MEEKGGVERRETEREGKGKGGGGGGGVRGREIWNTLPQSLEKTRAQFGQAGRRGAGPIILEVILIMWIGLRTGRVQAGEAYEPQLAASPPPHLVHIFFYEFYPVAGWLGVGERERAVIFVLPEKLAREG